MLGVFPHLGWLLISRGCFCRKHNGHRSWFGGSKLISGVSARRFPERIIEAVRIAGLPEDTPELELACQLAAYDELRMKRIASLPTQKASMAKLAFVGLQQRLLSSVAAFARTLKVHKATLQRMLDGEAAGLVAAAALAFVEAPTSEDSAELGLEDDRAEKTIDADDDATAEAASALGAADAAKGDLRTELTAVDDMLAIAERHASRPDARVHWLTDWIKANLLAGRNWNRRRLIIFTEYEDTRRWLERRLREAVADTDRADDRIGVFTGATGSDRREEVKRAFNTDPDVEPLRILICTDAAREGINLQAYCSDLIHFDLPWNPSRLEQRNGLCGRQRGTTADFLLRAMRGVASRRSAIWSVVPKSGFAIAAAPIPFAPSSRHAPPTATGKSCLAAAI
jgi:hypothetical protein